MPDYFFMGKSQLSRGFSFPLKRSLLDKVLDKRGITTVTTVSYGGPSDDRRVLCADYRGPIRRAMTHSLTLWVNAVPSALRHSIAQQIEQQWLTQLTDWIAQFGDRSKLASQMEHRFEIYYDEVTEDGTCALKVQLDEPRKFPTYPKFRAKVRP